MLKITVHCLLCYDCLREKKAGHAECCFLSRITSRSQVFIRLPEVIQVINIRMAA